MNKTLNRVKQLNVGESVEVEWDMKTPLKVRVYALSNTGETKGRKYSVKQKTRVVSYKVSRVK